MCVCVCVCVRGGGGGGGGRGVREDVTARPIWKGRGLCLPPGYSQAATIEATLSNDKQGH